MTPLTFATLREVARMASKHFPHCAIGGGAPRDVYLGGDVKDIDLFVDTREMPEGAYESAVPAFLAEIAPGGYIEQTNDPSVEADASYDLHSGDLPPIQILPVSRCVFNDVHDYDFGLSQILVTKDGYVFTTAFLSDVEGFNITYMKPGYNARSAERLRRIHAKYPQHTPVNCGTLLL